MRGYRPSLPVPVYRWTQLLFHHFQTRLVLLRMRGRVPAEAVPATPAARLAAGVADAAFCLGLARFRPRRALVLAAVYHVACWRLTGVTVGGAFEEGTQLTVTAYVHNADRNEVVVMFGQKETTYRDPVLVKRLLDATR